MNSCLPILAGVITVGMERDALMASNMLPESKIFSFPEGISTAVQRKGMFSFSIGASLICFFSSPNTLSPLIKPLLESVKSIKEKTSIRSRLQIQSLNLDNCPVA
ncbi:hypothetical protein B879_03071 [Cecembia lonarensis LW9]|uniref:Uncharacterized protein n=1 Tax=Cecembia lonarensis (strain CCUG 58316 / KCTC 22772 / LW9) TaxID=1225176 RepID=K1L873_CECL9|nr:hypothetical protein B879_03071 [Cecembia lonarensis LW9]